MKRFLITLQVFAAVLLLGGCQRCSEKTAEQFIESHVKKVKPIANKVTLAYWDSAITGKKEDYQRHSRWNLKLRRIYTNPEEFEAVKGYKESGQITDAITARQIQLLYNKYLANQIDPELLKQIVELSSEIEEKFYTFRGKIDGREISGNETSNVLKVATDSQERKQAWLASKQVGKVVADDIIRLVKLRNKAAKSVGFENYHTLVLRSGEQNPQELDRIFAELDKLTRSPFAKLKGQLDRILAGRCNIAVSEMMPWHYHDPFFQETPMVYEQDLDVYYKDKDIEKLSAKFYDGIGLNVDSILANSDLYEKPGKNPHGFCEDMDRNGDVRVLCNVVSNEKWTEVTLHELGHGVYFKYYDPQKPYLLREPAHSFTTEAIAMIFGRLSSNAAWMQQMLELDDEQYRKIKNVSGDYAKLGQLIFARWVLVMYNFEKQLYADPEQDLNSLWWDMVERYQMVNRPASRNEPDWAAKFHFVMAPCYYHNYSLGEMLASQLNNYIVKNILGLESDTGVSYIGRKEVGEYLYEKVFKPGSFYHWNEMIERATGEKLTPKYFADEFVN